MERQKSITGPGTANSPVTYGLHDRVMRVEVSEKVKEAKRDTLDHFAADVLCVKGPQWNGSNEMSKSKHGIVVSDACMSNTLRSEQLNSKDIRTLNRGSGSPISTTTHQFQHPVYGGTHNTAFERGFASDGWDQSTVRDPKKDEVVAATLVASVHRSPVRRAMQEKLATTYVEPVQRQTLLNERLRQQKEESSGARRLSELTAKYGPDGAQAMLQIEQMPSPMSKARIRTRPEDLAAVLSLPEPPELVENASFISNPDSVPAVPV